MPVYNAELYLLDAVRSIFAQTISDWELIMIDDASTDNSWHLMQKINDPRVIILRNETNQKQAYTQNKGIEAARGKFIARMDADDLSYSQRFEKQLNYLEKNPEVDLIGCGSISVYKNLEPFLVTKPVESHDEIIQYAGMYFPILHGGMMGKSEWFKKWRANPKMKYAQDFEFLFKSYLHSKFGNIKDILYAARFVGGTSPVSRKIESVYYKALTLFEHGFKKGLYKQTLLGLLSLVPRPALYLLKAAVGKNEKALIKARGSTPEPADILEFRNELERIFSVEVPLKNG